MSYLSHLSLILTLLVNTVNFNSSHDKMSLIKEEVFCFLHANLLCSLLAFEKNAILLFRERKIKKIIHYIWKKIVTLIHKQPYTNVYLNGEYLYLQCIFDYLYPRVCILFSFGYCDTLFRTFQLVLCNCMESAKCFILIIMVTIKRFIYCQQKYKNDFFKMMFSQEQ